MRSKVWHTLPIFVFVASPFSAVVAAPNGLASHRAVYDLTLDKAADRSGITGLSGRLIYEFNGSACEGYTTTYRSVTRINNENSSQVVDQQMTTFEEGNGKSFSFATKSYVDQALNKEVRGTAMREGDNIKVRLEKPQTKSFDVGPALFPTQQMIHVIDRALAGQTFDQSKLFDGSEDADRALITTVVIGKKSKAGNEASEQSALGRLTEEPGWPVDMAYFDEKKNIREKNFHKPGLVTKCMQMALHAT